MFCFFFLVFDPFNVVAVVCFFHLFIFEPDRIQKFQVEQFVCGVWIVKYENGNGKMRDTIEGTHESIFEMNSFIVEICRPVSYLFFLTLDLSHI